MATPSAAEPLVRLADGTVKQVSPLTGTTVWTVPGRAHRPLPGAPAHRQPVEPGEADRLCAFCVGRMREATPEKARVVADPTVRVLRFVPASARHDTVPVVRRIPNLFEIVGVNDWRANHGYVVPDEAVAQARLYAAEPAGREHLLGVLRARAEASGVPVPDDEALLASAVDLFAGSHDVIVARRHLVDGAQYADDLAGPGTLAPDEHALFMDLAIDTMADLYAAQPAAVYVAAFQNWLRPAGASFDHLHKQVVAIDEPGPQVAREHLRLRDDPQVFNHAVLDQAVRHGLVVARNDHAVAIAGVGHRYPALEVYATGTRHFPWDHTPAERHAVSDLVHAVHAAAGTHTPSNEEWHHRPPSMADPAPWRIVVKWRVSTLAGFEGGTKINVNTIDPWTLHDRVVASLRQLRADGAVAPMSLGKECDATAGMLGYAN